MTQYQKKCMIITTKKIYWLDLIIAYVSDAEAYHAKL